MPTQLEPIFELKGVTQRFDRVTALANVSLKIYPHDRVALVGASGAGKSTLLRLLNGTLHPTQGEVWGLGRNLGSLSPRRLRRIQRQIGTIYQQFHLVDTLRVIHNVNAGHLGDWSFLKAAASLIVPLEVETARQALCEVGIPEKLYERTDRLSGGQQQRVAIARVLIQNPAVILADEPIASLDPQRSLAVMDLLREIAERQGKTLITSIHAIEFARSHYNRIIGLRGGRILFDLPTKEVGNYEISHLYANDRSY
ncbi:ATP-binding cassette domain-containing protein [Lusitaniella coriacea LEGE 07157]|uniref:ATP-binding cassette domain-containing protein n=1 Tax=Lusitaniella coriacea LEGE 07157 TaxID=945747 RepID=A0A8J7DX85_9CYAN|nr:ATP-binding cassette domain-containing protein [Lusitaniella coriacea]MBE9116817.1 ATP-binding cassette domain-containing protein [Lusitaniella coriacea LEGE 07157]